MATNQSLDRALDIVECFSSERPNIGLSELAREVGLPKATVFRLAETLVQRGYLSKSTQDQSYQLGYKVIHLAHSRLATLDYRKIALPYMEKILAETGDSVTIYIPVNDDSRMCVERLQSTNGLSRIVNIGDIFPINRGGAGKVLLAYLYGAAIPEKYKVSKEEIEKIQTLGYAISYAEREEGVFSVAAPILDSHMKPIAALSVSGPFFHFEGERLKRIIEMTKAATAEISRELGCRKNR